MSNGSRDLTIEYGRKAAEALQGVHLFERAGMGKAPFRCVGFCKRADEQGKACGSCDYCGTGCMYLALVESSDGQKHAVGMDCAEKIGDAGLVRGIKNSPEFRALQRDKRLAKDEANKAEIAKLLADPRMPEFRRESFGYRLGWCGAAGRARIVREMREALTDDQQDVKP